ncbi:MAG TPA: CYTH and CHAD domain-containing protein [Gaiellales bacterium]|jgi:CHAD domain-containing protein
MKETMERERKLSVDADFTLPPLQVDTTPKQLRAMYYDTDDQRLARYGVTLRRRFEDGRPLWQLKLPTDGDRLEIEHDSPSPRVPDELARLVTAFVRGRELVPLAELHTLRRAVRVSSEGRAVAEVVHDTVQVHEDGKFVRSFSEVEIEQLEGGSEAHLEQLERYLLESGARPGDGRPKVFQALDLPAPGTTRVKRSAAPVEHLAEYLQAQLDALVMGDPPTRRGDVEGVHGMRVATRRMRSALKEGRKLLDAAWVAETRDELSWLGGVLGDVRDFDVFSGYVHEQVAGLGPESEAGGAELERLIQERSHPARARLAEALDAQRYIALLDRLETFYSGLPESSSGISLERLVHKAAWRGLRALHGVTARSRDEELHAVRLAAKRARYAAELGRRAIGRDAKRLAKRAADLQGLLGDHQDTVVAEERLLEIGPHGSPAAAFVAGRLLERERARRHDARAQLDETAERFADAARRV